MAEDFREDIKAMIRKHDPSGEELRSLATDLESLADRFEATDDAL